jgi:PLP dependent protein
LPTKDKIRENLASVLQRIESAAGRAGRNPADVTLVAVTKSVTLDEIRVLRDLGVSHFGENRIDVARGKIEILDDDAITWHMVGNVQRRKAKDVLRLFDTIDSVDRLSLAETLQRRSEAEDTRCRVLVEVNVSGEAQKHGFAPDALADALRHMSDFDRVQVDGLLTMAPRALDRDGLLTHFSELCRLADSLSLPVRSMGMSGDFEEAVEAGATQVRVGRALFD